MIELTQIIKGDASLGEFTTTINVSRIRMFSRNGETDSTLIEFGAGDYIIVKENYKTVKSKINRFTDTTSKII